MRRRKLVAVLACRNSGSRLYGKPMQNLSLNPRISILEFILVTLRNCPQIDGLVLAIADDADSNVFEDVAAAFDLPFVRGPIDDVLIRLICGGVATEATDIFRITTESPYVDVSSIAQAWTMHQRCQADATFLEPVIAGCGFEIIRLRALELSHLRGESRHRSEHCSLYLRENHLDFKIQIVHPPPYLQRPEWRLTADFPEDLILLRSVFDVRDVEGGKADLQRIVSTIETTPHLRHLTEQTIFSLR